jgi:hypothetical protein
VNVLSVSAAVVSYGSVSLAIVPEPPLGLKVMIELVSTGAVGVAIFDGVEYALLPNLLMAATTKR